jgi:hypothetical protein
MPNYSKFAGQYVSDAALNMQPYSDGGFTYYCEAAPGPAAALSAPVWRVARVEDAIGKTIYAGTGGFDQPATNLATVAALTYTLGA